MLQKDKRQDDKNDGKNEDNDYDRYLKETFFFFFSISYSRN